MESNYSKHILIVDDSEDQQFLLKMLLEARGYTINSTSNGEEALVLLRSNGVRPQLILLDLNMPVMDGYDFRRRQAADPLLRDIPVIVMSGEENKAEARGKTNSEVISKPLDVKTLLSTLERRLGLH